MSDDENLDNILNEALSEYREAEPLAGLEDRVLQRLRLQPEKHLATWWRWGAVAACAAALVLVALWIGIGRNRLHNSPPNQAVRQRQTDQVPVTTATGDQANTSEERSREQIATRHPDAHGQKSPASYNAAGRQTARLESTRVRGAEALQFPSPTPLTPEEHALLALARANPDALLNQPDHSGDLEIAPIAIKPLAGSDAPAQENSNE